MERRQSAVVSRDERFAVSTKNYSKQYSHLYTVRLNQVRSTLSQLARTKWGDDIPIVAKIIDGETMVDMADANGT